MFCLHSLRFSLPPAIINSLSRSFIIIIELSVVQFGLKSYACF